MKLEKLGWSENVELFSFNLDNFIIYVITIYMLVSFKHLVIVYCFAIMNFRRNGKTEIKMVDWVISFVYSNAFIPVINSIAFTDKWILIYKCILINASYIIFITVLQCV